MLYRLALLALSFLPPAAIAAPDGALLYGQNCAACHGPQGQGGVGIPLAQSDFLAAVDDGYLVRTIRVGRPGRVMPAFAQLEQAEVAAIVAHIRGWGEGEAPVRDERTIAGDPQRGKGLYDQHCAACHGADGGGGHGTGVTFSRPRDLSIMAPALNNEGFLAAATDSMIKTTLMRGRSGTPMVSFLDRGLSERDIDDVVAYVRSFGQDPKRWEPHAEERPYLEYVSPYSLEETLAALKRAALGKNFRIIREQPLEEGLFPPEQVRDDSVILYFCNFQFINEALTVDPRVGLFMPCRVTVTERDGEVVLYSVNPKYMSRFFNNRELDEACASMHSIYVEIMEEATL